MRGMFCCCFVSCVALPVAVAAAEKTPGGKWRGYVQTCINTLIQHGRDVYGPIETPMFVGTLDVRTLEMPKTPLIYSGRSSFPPDSCNLWFDQPTLRTMYRLTTVTGETKYSRAADAYIAYAMKNCRKETGLLMWGSHSHYLAFSDQVSADRQHEILILHPLWDDYWRLDAKHTREMIEAIWEWHIADKETGLSNRHDDKDKEGCDFAFSQAEFAYAFGFLYSKTKESLWLKRARLAADWHARHRHAETGLVADAPHLPLTGNRTTRFDGLHTFTTIPGPHVALLLRCFEVTGDPHLLDLAVGYLKSYDKYAYDADAQNYWAALKLDGTPIPEQKPGEEYDRWMPSGYVNVWRTDMFSYEFAILAAQSYVYGYEVAEKAKGEGDPELLEAARRWANVIEKNLPPQVGRRPQSNKLRRIPDALEIGGTFAENYGRAISFYVHLYRATESEKYLALAQNLAREAVSKLYENGLFKGHPAKPYYESCDGVGILLYALLELDTPSQDLGGNF